MLITSKTEVICLFGPTAVGKTEVLSQLFAVHPQFEVVSADSVQVYKGLNLGSAKPSPDELQKIPHHLIDILDPRSQFSAGEFVTRADQAVSLIRSRGAVPLLSGGTAFYFVNFLFGLPETPLASPELRNRVEAFVEKEGVPALHQILREEDPISHERLEINDLYRRKRALEVIWATGRPLSDFRRPRELRPGLIPRLFALQRPREELYARINRRVDRMMEEGFPREVERLLEEGVPPDCPSLKSIGYLQLSRWFRTGKPGSLDEVTEEIRRESRRYAKRQLTFFRSIPGVQWLDPSEAAEILGQTISTGKSFH